MSSFDKLPPLKTLRGFIATAQTGNVRSAAKQLNLSHSAISHQIQQLEENLNQQLFFRQAGRMSLTPAAEQLLPQVIQALELLQSAALQVRRPERQLLRLHCPVSLAIGWLPSWLEGLQQQHPQLEVAVQSQLYTSQQSKLASLPPGADLAIIYSEGGLDEQWQWHPLCRGKLTPLAAPTILEQYPDPLAAPINQISVYTSEHNWPLWRTLAGQEQQNSPSLMVDTHASALQLAAIGQGIALANSPIANSYLSSGQLVECGPSQNLAGYWGIIAAKNSPLQSIIDSCVELAKSSA